MSSASQKDKAISDSSSRSQPQIRVDRTAVDAASRSMSGMINKMTDQIVRDVSKALEQRQK